MHCTNCGSPIPDGAKFCTECGTVAPASVAVPVAAASEPMPAQYQVDSTAQMTQPAQYQTAPTAQMPPGQAPYQAPQQESYQQWQQPAQQAAQQPYGQGQSQQWQQPTAAAASPYQQPVAAAPSPQPQQPQSPAPKGNNKIIAIVVAALVVAGLVGGGVYAYLNHLGPFAGDTSSSSASASSDAADDDEDEDSDEGSASGKSTGKSSKSADPSTSADPSSGSASASSSATPTPSNVVIVGKWTLAALEYQGCIMAGDLSQYMGGDLVMDFKSNGKVQLTLGSSSEEGTWKANGSTYTVTDASGTAIAIEYNAKDGTLKLDMGNISSTYAGMAVIMTTSSSSYKAPVLEVNKAKPLSSIKDVEGKWKLSGIVVDGVSMTGSVAQAIGVDMAIQIKSDGSCTVSSGSQTVDGKVTASNKGVVLSVNGTDLEIKSLNGSLVIDFTSAGQAGIMVFSK